MLPFKFDIRLFIFLSIAFIFSTIVGTISHEYGHYAVAKSLGYSSKVSYGYTNWDNHKTRPFIDSIFSKYAKEVESNTDFPKKKEFDSIQEKQRRDEFWIILGGPIQTMLTGTIGFLLLLNQRKQIFQKNKITCYQWIVIFLSLFWLRQIANLITQAIGYFVNGKLSSRSDEVRLAVSLRIPKESISVATAIIAFALLTFVIFRIIPVDKRITFISAGLFGGVFGYLFWLVWVGPLIMP